MLKMTKCECNNSEMRLGTVLDFDNEDNSKAYITIFKNGTLTLEIETDDFHDDQTIKINYCPLCGRKFVNESSSNM
ncbi:hypothetical protein [Enterococcus gilvus]|uniref:hypothetical protein n=1 Tax=Enterococcus gilvus TaxID=160453 RepID=UPI001C8C930B|nr:hypothetical protein [Enterococcus gilvus]MBX8939231.1 hypothetical protein [Enterococcus gilvus]